MQKPNNLKNDVQAGVAIKRPLFPSFFLQESPTGRVFT